MICPKCGSTNILTQQQSDFQLKTKHHGIFWWIFIGWWWVPVKWIVFFPLSLLAKIFAPKRQRLKQSNYTQSVCQACGYAWKP